MKNKRVIYSIIVLIFIFPVLLILTYVIEKRDINRYLDAQTIDCKRYIDIALMHLSRQSNIFYDMLLNKERMRLIMSRASNTFDINEIIALREDLIGLYKKDYEYLKKYGVRQLNFYISEATTFVNFNNLKSYGDSVKGIRKTIDYVSLFKKPVHYYESGKGLNGFRNVYPIFDDKHFIGILEISYPFSAVHALLEKYDPQSEYLLLIDLKSLRQKLFEDDIGAYVESVFPNFGYDKETFEISKNIDIDTICKINMDIAPLVEEKFKYEKIFSLFFQNSKVNHGKGVIITFTPIRDINRHTVAYTVRYKNDNFISTIIREFYTIYVLEAIVILLLFLFIVIL